MQDINGQGHRAHCGQGVDELGYRAANEQAQVQHYGGHCNGEQDFARDAGVAGNVIPPTATIQINYRFAPDKTTEQARQYMEDLFHEWPMNVLDLSAPASTGLDRPLAKSFVAAVGGEPGPKYGWTDVARFGQLGIPAVNFGPGNALCAHQVDECCRLGSLDECYRALHTWLASR